MKDRNEILQQHRLLDKEDVLKLIKVCSNTLDKLISQKGFPPPLNTGLRKHHWKASSVIVWINKCEELSHN